MSRSAYDSQAVEFVGGPKDGEWLMLSPQQAVDPGGTIELPCVVSFSPLTIGCLLYTHDGAIFDGDTPRVRLRFAGISHDAANRRR